MCLADCSPLRCSAASCPDEETESLDDAHARINVLLCEHAVKKTLYVFSATLEQKT